MFNIASKANKRLFFPKKVTSKLFNHSNNFRNINRLYNNIANKNVTYEQSHKKKSVSCRHSDKHYRYTPEISSAMVSNNNDMSFFSYNENINKAYINLSRLIMGNVLYRACVVDPHEPNSHNLFGQIYNASFDSDDINEHKDQAILGRYVPITDLSKCDHNIRTILAKYNLTDKQINSHVKTYMQNMDDIITQRKACPSSDDFLMIYVDIWIM